MDSQPTLQTILAQLIKVAADVNDMKAGVQELNQHMDRFEGRMDRLENRMDQIETRMDRLEGRMDRLDEQQEFLFKRMERSTTDAITISIRTFHEDFNEFKKHYRYFQKETVLRVTDIEECLDTLEKSPA